MPRERIRRERRRRRRGRRRRGVGRVDVVDPSSPLSLLPFGRPSSSTTIVSATKTIARRCLLALSLLSLLASSSSMTTTSLLVDSSSVVGSDDDDGAPTPLSMTCRSIDVVADEGGKNEDGGGEGGKGRAKTEGAEAVVVECTFSAGAIEEEETEEEGGASSSRRRRRRPREVAEHCSEETGLCVRATVEVYPFVGGGTSTSATTRGRGLGASGDGDDDASSYRTDRAEEGGPPSSAEEEEKAGASFGGEEGEVSSQLSSPPRREEDRVCDDGEDVCVAKDGGTTRSADGDGRGEAEVTGGEGGSGRDDSDVVTVGSVTYEPPFGRRYGSAVAEIVRSIRSVPVDLPKSDPRYVDFVVRRADLCVELGVAHRNDLAARLAESLEGTATSSEAEARVSEEYGMARNAFDEASRLYESLSPSLLYEEERDAFELLNAEVYVYIAETILNYAPLVVAHGDRGDGGGFANEREGEGTKEALRHYERAERIYRSVLDRDDARHRRKGTIEGGGEGGNGGFNPPPPMDESSREIAEFNFADALAGAGVAMLNVVVASDDVVVDIVDEEETTDDEGGGGATAGEAALRRATDLARRALVKIEAAVDVYRRRGRDDGTINSPSSSASAMSAAAAPRLADALYSVGSANTYLADFDGAISAWEESLSLYRRLEETTTTRASAGEEDARTGMIDDDNDRGFLIMETLMSLSDAYVQSGRYDEAKVRYAEAMRRYETAGAAGAAFDDDVVRSFAGGEGIAATASSTLRPSPLASDESLRSYRDALDAYLESIGEGGVIASGREVPIPDDLYVEGDNLLPPDELYEADLRSGLGYAYLERNDLRSALEELRVAADLYERSADSAEDAYEEEEDAIATALGDVLMNVANAHLRLGEYDESSSAFGRAADVYRNRVEKDVDEGRRTDESGGGGVSTRGRSSGGERRASERLDGNDFVDGEDGSAATEGGAKTAKTDGIRERIVDIDEYQRGLINLTSVVGAE